MGGNDRVPSDQEIKQAFKDEMGREPTAKELEDFKEQAAGPEPEEGAFPKDTMPTDADLKAAFKDVEGREPTADELQDLRASASEPGGL